MASNIKGYSKGKYDSECDASSSSSSHEPVKGKGKGKNKKGKGQGKSKLDDNTELASTLWEEDDDTELASTLWEDGWATDGDEWVFYGYSDHDARSSASSHELAKGKSKNKGKVDDDSELSKGKNKGELSKGKTKGESKRRDSQAVVAAASSAIAARDAGLHTDSSADEAPSARPGLTTDLDYYYNILAHLRCMARRL